MWSSNVEVSSSPTVQRVVSALALCVAFLMLLVLR
jgi:hypothetical protein